MIILGIESSCDDTSVALLEANKNGFIVLSEKTSSQIEVHKKYGGVVPEIAGRMHAENIMPLVEDVLEKTKIATLQLCSGQARTPRNGNNFKPDVIAVTSGPGLITGLLVGVEAAKVLSYLWEIPLISVNHISGHVHSVQIQNSECRMQNNEIKFPAVCLVVSGGHTELLLMKSHDKFELLGKTRDDAAGETFDKVAKLIGFEYPGGAKISQTAEWGNVNAINFPRPMLQEGYEFSFAGLKTSALYWLRDNAKPIHATNNPTSYPSSRSASWRITTGHSKLQVREHLSRLHVGATSLRDFCASFQEAIIDVLVTKTLRATKEFKPKSVILAGGVSANKKLRETLEQKITETNCKLLIPEIKYTMDNAAMIAVAGYYKAIQKDFTPWQKIEANPNWRLA